MPQPTEPSSMSPGQRLREVAAILARGILRLHRIEGSVHASESQNSTKNGLELSGETRLSVSESTRGLRLRDDGDNA